MKNILKFSLLILLATACTSNRYLLTDKGADKKFLIDFIKELSARGEISKQPLLVVDGVPKRFTKELKDEKLELSKGQIASVDRLKQNKAEGIYGEEAKGGVLLISTKAKEYEKNLPFDKKKVLYLIGNKEFSYEELMKINPNDIMSITVVKGKEDMKPYTTKDYEGVIIIQLKEK